MTLETITPDIYLIREQKFNTVLVRGREGVTALGVPASRAAIALIKNQCLKLADGGLRTIILTHERTSRFPYGDLGGVRIIRADRIISLENTDALKQQKTHEVEEHRIQDLTHFMDDGIHTFVTEPGMETACGLSVLIQPEDALVIGDELHPDLPPVIEPGCVQPLLWRMGEWLVSSPKFLLSPTGQVLKGDDIRNMLDRNISYLRKLEKRLREGIVEGHFPWERMVQSIAWEEVWDAPCVSRELLERHRAAIRNVALDIEQRLRATA